LSEILYLPDSPDKETRYQAILPQAIALTEGESDFIANLANITAILKFGFNFFWVGFYLVRGGELVLGPFQGPVACTRIRSGQGVCGTALQKKEAVIVPDVNNFPGHIACSDQSKSEIVVPAMHHQEVFLVLDIDSDQFNTFDDIDRRYLEELIHHIEKLFSRSVT
jgi:GAF domain-containing protein